MSRTLFTARYRRRAPNTTELTLGDKITLGYDVSVIEDELGDTVSNVDFTTDESSMVSFSNETVSSKQATALVSADSEGSALVDVKFTFSGSQEAHESLHIRVVEPEPRGGFDRRHPWD